MYFEAFPARARLYTIRWDITKGLRQSMLSIFEIKGLRTEQFGYA